MAVPSQGTVAVGDKITASLWNDDVRDAVNFLISPPRCKLYRTANASLTTATWTAVQWTGETFDTDTMHDNTTNNTRITFTTAGTYQIVFNALFAASSAGARQITIEKNGTTTQGSGTAQLESFTVPSANATNSGHAVTVIAEFAAADYITVFVQQTSGGALNLLGTSAAYTSVTARWIAT